MPTQSGPPSSSVRTANRYVRHCHHATLEPHPFVNAHHLFHHPSSYNGYQNTPTSLAITSQIEQRRSNHNWVRYYLPHTTFMRVSGHQWIISWRSTFARPQNQNLRRSQDFDWSTADKNLQRWCTNCSILLLTSPVAKGSLSSDWPWNWSYVSIIPASRTHTTTFVSWMPNGRCY